jgi:predicted  nucleic acid-binding Zn-ribbon protein
MLHEIEGVEREIRAIEDRILEDMEAAERQGASANDEERRFKEAEATHREESQDVGNRRQKLEAEREQARGEREAVAETLPPDLLLLFQRVARLRGTGVAEARDGMCQQCRMALRPQMYVELKHNDQVTQCPSCSRILYYAPPVPAVEAPTA